MAKKNLSTTHQLLLELPKKPGWHHLPLVVSAANQKTIAVLQQPHQWQDGILALTGEQGSGKSFMAWYLFAKQSHHGLLIENNNMDWTGNRALTPQHVIIWDNVDENLANLAQLDAEQLCHFFNQNKESRPKLLLLTQQPLPQILQSQGGKILPDVISRLSLVSSLHLLADDAGLHAQALGFFAERQIAIDDKTVQSLLRHGPRDHRALYQLLSKLDEYSLQTKKPIGPKMIQQWLQADAEKMATD